MDLIKKEEKMKFFEKNELKLLWPFYLDSLISPMLFFAPAFFIVYFAYLNFTFFQIGILMAMSHLTIIFFEIPTGAIADLYGRKFSVLFGYLLEGIAVLALFFVKDYLAVLLVFIFWGIATTFSSGSKEAWVIDLIKKQDKNLTHSFFNKTQSIDSFALIISGFIGAFLVKISGLSIIWSIAAFSFFISFTILLFAKEVYIKRKVKIKESFSKTNKQAWKSILYSYRHHVLFYFILAEVLLTFALNIQSSVSWIAFLKELGISDYAFGYVWSAMGFVIMVSPVVTSKFLKKNKERNFMIFCLIIWAAITFMVLFAFKLLFALTIMLLAIFFYFTQRPAERVYFHRFIPSKLRATVGSLSSMLTSLASALSFILAGFLVDNIGSRYTIFISSFLVIPAILILYFKIKD